MEEDESQSILLTTKKLLSIPSDYPAFDLDVVVHINTVFMTLYQLGVGPEAGFEIKDETATWDQYLDGDPLLNSVKTYMYLSCRLKFDPPGTSYLINAIEKQMQELEWRINTQVEFIKARRERVAAL